MTKSNINYAVSNDTTYNQYVDTTNPVTRNTLLNILKRRLESGDETASTYLNAIESMRCESTTSTELAKYNDRELLFIATHAMVPYTINRLVRNEIDVPSGMSFSLGGTSYLLDHYDMLHSEHDSSPASPEFLVRVIEEYDPEQIATNKIVNEIFEPLCDASGLSVYEYIQTTLAVVDFVREHRVADYVDLEECPIRYIEEALVALDSYDIRHLANQVSKSITPLHLSYRVSKTSVLELHRSLKGGLRISDRELKGTFLSAREWRDTESRGAYVIKIKEADLKWPTSEWSFVDNDESLLMNIALNIVGLCTTMNNGIERALLQQIELQRNASFDTYVYDKTSPESIIALGLAVYRSNKARNFKYEFIDVSDEIDLAWFRDKTVCFTGASYDDEVMSLISNLSRRVFTLGNQPDESVVAHAWRKLVGKPYPFLIKLFDSDPESYILTDLKRGIQRTVNATVLQTIVPLTEELIQTADHTSIVLPDSVRVLMELGLEEEDSLGANVVDLRIHNNPF